MCKSNNSYRNLVAVDLDGTLTLTDTLHESVLQLLRDRPWQVLALPIWLLRGKAYLKAKISDQVSLNPQTLPYNQALITWLKEQKDLGRKIVLCTATDQRIAQRIADHLSLFDTVIASDGHTNIAGKNKRAVLEAAYGERGYDYAGNSATDLTVWGGAANAIVVNAPAQLADQAAQVTTVSHIFPAPAIPLSAWRRVFRVHQWLKNLLLFVPLLAAHQLGNTASLVTLLWAFLAFSLCASAVYISNDLLDLESDRQHPRKCRRPFASGVVPINRGAFLAPVCAITSLVFAIIVGPVFAAWMVAYLALTAAYSISLKRYALVDCLTLAGLYTLRIVAGAAAISVPLSFWLLAFSVFIFLSLAFVKRYAELQVQAAHGKTTAHGRGYQTTDASLVQTLGIAAGYAAVLVLALYLHSETVTELYQMPKLIWGAVPLMLFWISWVWLQAHRGKMHDDPIVFALKDRSSLVAAALIGLCFTLASQLGGAHV